MDVMMKLKIHVYEVWCCVCVIIDDDFSHMIELYNVLVGILCKGCPNNCVWNLCRLYAYRYMNLCRYLIRGCIWVINIVFGLIKESLLHVIVVL